MATTSPGVRENPNLPRPIDELGTIVLSTSLNVRRTVFAPFPLAGVRLPPYSWSSSPSFKFLITTRSDGEEQSGSRNFTNQGHLRLKLSGSAEQVVLRAELFRAQFCHPGKSGNCQHCQADLGRFFPSISTLRRLYHLHDDFSILKTPPPLLTMPPMAIEHRLHLGFVF